MSGTWGPPHAKGKIICPINDAVLAEVMKQSDSFTRTKTAELMDILSNGVVLKCSNERIEEEIIYSIKSRCGEQIERPMIWTIPAFVFGKIDKPRDIESFIQNNEQLSKLLYEKFYGITIVDVVSNTSIEKYDEFEQKAIEINEQSNENKQDIRSLEKAYDIEFTGLMSLFVKKVKQCINEEPNKRICSIEEDKRPLWMIRNELYPSIHAAAMMHAHFRIDFNRKMNGHDIFDIQIGASALPYFDYFFTEKSLCSLINSSSFKRLSNYKCKVLASEKEILDSALTDAQPDRATVARPSSGNSPWPKTPRK